MPRKDLFSDSAKRHVDENEIYISPAVLLELEYRREIGRLAVGGNAIYQELHRRIALKLCELEFHRVVQGALEQTWTRDPFDRLIVGHAQSAGRSLLTRDAAIGANYPAALW